MKIIIVGCGKVGEELAAALSQEGNDITVIDKNDHVLDNLRSQYDVMGLVGNGANYSVQLEADIMHADLMIAVTGSDELNLLSCLIAKKAGNCHTIARVRNPEYSTQMAYLKEELGLAMVINQEQTAAREIARVLRFPSAIEIDTFAKGRVELLRFRVPEQSVLDQMSLIDMRVKLQCNVLVCTVERGGSIVIPGGDFVLHSGDVISIVSEARSEEQFFRKIGVRQNTIRDVMIIGGGDIAYYLADILGLTKWEVVSAVERMRQEGILADSKDLSAFLQDPGTSQRKTDSNFERFAKLERYILEHIPDEALSITYKQLNDDAVR